MIDAPRERADDLGLKGSGAPQTDGIPPAQGRANMRSMWESQQVDREGSAGCHASTDAVRTFGAPEALDIRFHEVHAKSALNGRGCRSAGRSIRIGDARHAGFRFARSTHLYLDLDAGRDFEREIVVKVNVPEVLRAELRGRREARAGRARDEHRPVPVGREPLPADAGIWQRAARLRHALLAGHEVAAALRDIDILQQPRRRSRRDGVLLVPTLDERGARRSRTRRRPRAARRCEDERGRDSVRRPDGALMPGINDSPEQVGEILRIAEDAGAISAAAIALHLRPGVKEVFFDWMRSGRPAALRGPQRT